MSEEIKNKAPEPELDPLKAAERVSHGKLILSRPIKDGEREVTELVYDFTALTSTEYADALDSVPGQNANAFRLTNRQALALFAAAAAKATPGLDVIDVRERLSVMDVNVAVQIATVFFIGTSRAGSARIMNA